MLSSLSSNCLRFAPPDVVKNGWSPTAFIPKKLLALWAVSAPGNLKLPVSVIAIVVIKEVGILDSREPSG